MCWGAGGYGQLGNGATTATNSAPVNVHTSSSDTAALSGIAAISSGSDHTCALTTGGNVKCWGAGQAGRLGSGATANTSVPVDVRTSSSDAAALSGIAAISSGRAHTCALTTSNNVKCWGSGSEGRLGNGATTNRSSPVDVRTSSSDSSALGGIAGISSGGHHVCASTGSNLVCWGRGGSGQLGNGATTNRSSPVDVQISLTNNFALGGIAAISFESFHTPAPSPKVATSNAGEVDSTGYWVMGRTGSRSTPVDVHASSSDPSILGGIAAISSERSHTCVLTEGGNAKCWGAGGPGQWGNGGALSSSTPVDVHTSSSNNSALDGIAGISSGRSHTCALTTGGNVVCWGVGSSGRLGNGGTASSSTPVDVHTSSSNSSALDGIAGISSGRSHTCALTTGSNVVCWGAGSSGRLGNGGTDSSSTPVDVHTSSSNSSALGGIAGISSGDFHTCALTIDGNVKCWGSGNDGRLGNKATINSLTPVDVHASLTDNSALDGIAGISSGNSHTCALTTGGNVVCWGAGDFGQLGNGGTSNRSTPVDVQTSSSDSSALSGIAAISSGDTHTCALTTGGNVKCWGYGLFGQLGNGGADNSLTPVDVHTGPSNSSALSGIAAISSGSNHTCALTEGNNVVCWGDESSGQLGNNGVGVPVSIIGLDHH